MNYLKWTKDLFTGSSGEEDFNSLSQEELVQKASQLDFENKQMEEKLEKMKKENFLLSNSIINKNNKKQSEYSNFLKLMEANLLNLNDNSQNKNYSIDTFKKFLYLENIFQGTLEEDNIKFLPKKKDMNNNFNWEKDKENYQLKQEIIQNNLKALYSNMFIIKENKINNIIEKDENTKENKVNEDSKKDDVKQKSNNSLKENKFMNPDSNYIGAKKDKEVNVFEDILLD